MSANEVILKHLSVAPVTQLAPEYRSKCADLRDKIATAEEIRDLFIEIYNLDRQFVSEFARRLVNPEYTNTDRYMFDGKSDE